MPLSPIPGANVMLVGPTGTGKTTAIRTLVDAGIEVFALLTEPFMDILADLPPERCHWHYIAPANPDWSAILDNARKINALNYQSLSDLKSGLNKQQYSQFIDILNSLSDFRCDRTGKSYGAVDSWSTGRALVVDSLSGLSVTAMDLVVGAKPTKNPGEWSVAMDNLERLINKLCFSTRCFFVLTAHVEREIDEIGGGIKLMASTLGKKLAPKLPRFFHEVVLCQREGTHFTWSTAAVGVDLKAKYLPIAENLAPTFVPLVEAWKAKGGILEPTNAS